MHHYSHTSHPCARLFLPHIQAAVPLTKIICRRFYVGALNEHCCFRFTLSPIVFYIVVSPFLPVFTLEIHVEEYSPVSAEARIFIILLLRCFRIMKNYLPLDSCPDVSSFQLLGGNQACREKTEAKERHSQECGRGRQNVLLKNLFHLLSAEVNAVKTIFSRADGVKSVISSGDPIQSLYLKNLSNLSANGASE